MAFTPGFAIRILTHEGARAGRHSLMEALIEVVKRERLAGVTITRALEGYSAHGGARTSNWADLGDDLPLTIEIIDSVERIERVLPEITALVKYGTLTVTETRLYTAHES